MKIKSFITHGLWVVGLFIAASNAYAAPQVPAVSAAPAASASSPISQPIFAVEADHKLAKGGAAKIELPEDEPDQPDQTKVAKAKTPMINIWATRINYDSKLWFIIFLMPFAAAFFLLSSIKSYFKGREDWRKSIAKENIQLPRTQMGE